MPAPDWLIWSNEHDAWWRPNSVGYTTRVDEAGRYTKDEAQRIANSSDYRLLGVTERALREGVPPEVAIPAAAITTPAPAADEPAQVAPPALVDAAEAARDELAQLCPSCERGDTLSGPLHVGPNGDEWDCILSCGQWFAMRARRNALAQVQAEPVPPIADKLADALVRVCDAWTVAGDNETNEAVLDARALLADYYATENAEARAEMRAEPVPPGLVEAAEDVLVTFDRGLYRGDASTLGDPPYDMTDGEEAHFERGWDKGYSRGRRASAGDASDTARTNNQSTKGVLMDIDNGCPILLTTAHRGVFFGRFVARDGNHVTVSDARNCVYWTTDERGFLGLASEGPGEKCRIGPKVDRMEIRDVTSIATVSDGAVAKWDAAPWS